VIYLSSKGEKQIGVPGGRRERADAVVKNGMALFCLKGKGKKRKGGHLKDFISVERKEVPILLLEALSTYLKKRGGEKKKAGVAGGGTRGKKGGKEKGHATIPF